MHRTLAATGLFLAIVTTGTTAQDARTIISNASKAMGAENLTAITYSGSAANVNFGQTKSISGPYVLATSITNYTRAIDLNQPASRASGTTLTPAPPGAPPAQPVIPNKPIRYVVNTHAHFDHASGLAPIAAEGITIITHEHKETSCRP